jgi:hypothetical protein
LSLLVSLSLLLHLFLEVGLLDERVVQLGVGVAHFSGSDESFESFAESGDRSVVLGERGHDLRVTDNEGGRDALVFDELSDELRIERERLE